MTTPPDLVLVPREPTQEMIEAGLALDEVIGRALMTGTPAQIWEAMIASAPSQEGGWRDAIIEECARIADLHASSQEERERDGNYEFHEGRDYSCDEIARAIRSLKKRDGSEKM